MKQCVMFYLLWKNKMKLPELPELYEITKKRQDWDWYETYKGIEELIGELVEEVNKQGKIIEYLLSIIEIL